MRLCDVVLNQKYVVKKLYTEGAIHRRLQEIGIIPGNIIECVLVSPFQDPKAYKINGTVIAIRNRDSKRIEVSSLE